MTEFNPLDRAPLPDTSEVASEGVAPEAGASAVEEPAEVVAAAPEGSAEAPEAEASPEVPEQSEGVEASEPESPSRDEVDRWSERFDALSRRDAEIRNKERSLKEAEARLEELAQFQKLLKDNPAAAVSKLGLTMDDIYRHQVQESDDDPGKRIELLEKAQREKLHAMEQKLQAMELQRVGDQWEAQFAPALGSEEYALVREWDGGVDIVRQHVAQTYQETGELLTPKQALDTIKAELETRLNKLRASGVFGAPPAGQADQPEAPQVAVKRGPKTVTPALASAPPRADQWLDDESEMMRIAAKYAT